MRFYLTAFLVVITNISFCQSKQLTVKQIDSIVAKINCVKNYDRSIDEGTIANIRKGLVRKIFVRKTAGAYYATVYSDSATNRIAKITYERSLRRSFDTKTFFYKDDSLIFVDASKRNGSLEFHPLSNGQFYFQQGVFVKRTGKDSLTKPESLVKTSRRLLKDAYDTNPLRK